jgi:hypothetical protein
MFTLNWTFRNTHKWSKVFENLDSLEVFLYTCGLVSHPDIVSVHFVENGNKIVLKETS